MINQITIGIVGTRGIPANYGGYETFAQEIAQRLVKMGMKCIVYCDQDSYAESQYNGVDLVYMKTTKSKNPLKYYYDGLVKSFQQCDVIYVTGLGAAIFYPLFINKGKILITNTDGIEYNRDKWSFAKKIFLRICEYLDVRYSNFVVADSKGIQEHLIRKYKMNPGKIWMLEYGAYVNHYTNDQILRKFGIKHKEYYLIVSRLEPENNVHIMIDGYLLNRTEKPLIVVGNLKDTKYVKKLMLNKSDKVRFVGGVYDPQELNALRSSCFAHLHGHSVGGTNPSLLEALGSGNIVIAHDNVFNREVIGENMFGFKNPTELSLEIRKVELLNDSEKMIISDNARKRITDYYNWENIASRYYDNIQKLFR